MKRHITTSEKFFLVLFSILVSFTSASFAQNVSTEGTDFWLGYLPHDAPGSKELQIFISTSQDTVTGTISLPGSGVIHNFTLGAGSSSSLTYTFPTSLHDDVSSSARNTVARKSVHIESDNPISVYALNKAQQWSADATIVLPTVTLGKQYFATCHNDDSAYPSSIMVMGVEDQTDIDIVPSENVLGGASAGTTIPITLGVGETYLIESNGDLTGTKISTRNSSDGDCKNFAVFSGVNRTLVGNCSPGYDHLYQQSYPVKAWGSNFTFLPFQDRVGGDLVKVIAYQDTTTINITGFSPITINSGEFRQFTIQNVSTITADKPISVTQLSRSAACDNTPVDFGDPFMITLSPNEQLLKKITFSAFPVFSLNDFTYYVDIIAPTASASSVNLVDGNDNTLALNFSDVGNGFSYSQVTLSQLGEHVITSDEGFIANVYGFGTGVNSFESFGYTTGASLNNLNFSIISIDSGQFDIGDTEILCLGNSIAFSPDIDSSFQFFEWDMGDGTTFADKDVEHTYAAPGIYNVTVKAFTALGDCATEQTAVKTIEIRKSDFGIKGPASVCPNTSDIVYSSLDPKGEYSYSWTVVGGNIASGDGSDTLFVDWGPTNANASISAIAIDDLGCDDTTHLDIIINDVLEPSSPIGPDSICYSGLTQLYEAILANGNAYNWFVEGGTLTDDTSNPDGNTVYVTWDTTATEHKLWYKEFNLADTICAGVSDTFFVETIMPEIKTLTLDVTDVSCYGFRNGAIDYTAQGGLGSLNYIYDNDTVPNSILLEDLFAGTYTIQVMDGVGCSIFPEIEVAEPDSFTVDYVIEDVLCFGESTGSILVNVTGGTLPYTFTWSNGISQDTNFVQNLPEGDYQVKITDANGCEKFSPFLTIDENPRMGFTISGPDSVCQFTSGKTYTITDDVSDTYTWFVEGGTITSGQNTDEIQVEWGPLGDGVVKAVSQNSLGCVSDTIPFDVVIYAYPKPDIASGPDSLCFSNIIAVRYEASPTAGRGYNWFAEGGEITIDPSEPAGNVVTVNWIIGADNKIWFEEYVIDEPICAATSDTLEVEILPELTATTDFTRVSCFGGSDGTATVTAIGGVGNYTYSWSHDAGLTDAVATNLSAGNYIVTVTDGFNCSEDFSIDVIQPDAPLAITLASTTDVLCFGESTGVLTVNIDGGTTPYTIQWDDPLMQTTATATQLPVGTYKVVVTDSSLCIDSASYEIEEPAKIVFGITGPDSACQFTTAKEYSIDVPDPTYTYTWTVEGSTGASITSGQGTDKITVTWGSQGSGIVKATAENILGCISETYSFDVLVYEYPQPAAPAGQDSVCYNDNSVHAYTATYQDGRAYDWFIEGGTLTVDASEPNGTKVNVVWNAVDVRKIWFREYVIDESICEATSEVLELTVLSQSFGDIVSTPVSCFGAGDGIVTISKNGGVGDYRYSWSHDVSLTTNVASGLSAGNYSVTLMDEFGCTSELSVEVTQPEAPPTVSLVALEHIVCEGDSTGSIEIEINGGTAPYSIQWNDYKQQTGLTATDLPAGDYEVIVNDAGNSCADTVGFTLNQPDAFNHEVLDTLPSRCKVPEGMAQLKVTGGTPSYKFEWTTTNNASGSTGRDLPAGVNPVIVTDAKGCTYPIDVYILSKDPEIYYPNAFTPNGDGVNDTFQLIYTCEGGDLEFTVYNKWGNMVFNTSKTDEGWDGNVNNTPQPAGVYTYRMRYKITLDGELFTFEKNGSIVLFR